MSNSAHIPVNSPSKTHWFTRADLGGSCTLVCRGPLSGVCRRVLSLSRKGFVAQQMQGVAIAGRGLREAERTEDCGAVDVAQWINTFPVRMKPGV